MKTGTGALVWFLGLAVLLVSSASTRVEAHVAPRFRIESKPASPFTASVDATLPLAAAPSLRQSPKLRRMRKSEISPAMLDAAALVVRHNYARPVGTQIEVDIDGKHLYARIERHYHPEGGPVKPWGFHPGVSLFCER